LTKLKKFFEKADIKTKELVLTIPSYCSNVERQSLLDACEIAGLRCVRILNESTALALQYGFFRKKDLDAEKARIVAIVDVGHSKTTITIASFLQGKTKIICHKSDRNLGARDWDYALMEMIGGKFKDKYGSDPRKNTRCKLRMLEGIEKARKMISACSDANINIEYLLDEEDLNHMLKRDEFESVCAPFFERFTQLCKDTIEGAGLTTEQIDNVEMFGDATRTPIILELTKTVFNKTETFRTLNSLEAVAKGAALQAAMLSPLFSVASFSVEEYNPLPVQITYSFNGVQDKSTCKELFKLGSTFPITQSVTFDNKNGDCDLLISYSESARQNLIVGLPDQIAQYKVHGGSAKHAENKCGGSKLKFRMKISNDIH